MSHIVKNYQRFITFWSCKQFKICDPSAGKVFDDFYLSQLHCIDLKSEVLKSYEKMTGSITESCDASDIKQIISHQKTISTFTHHTVCVLVSRHSLYASTMEFVLNLPVDIFWKVIFNQLDAFEEGTAQRKHIGVWGRNVKVRLRDRGLRNAFQKHSFQ